jgi:hypothetical protein
MYKTRLFVLLALMTGFGLACTPSYALQQSATPAQQANPVSSLPAGSLPAGSSVVKAPTALPLANDVTLMPAFNAGQKRALSVQPLQQNAAPAARTNPQTACVNIDAIRSAKVQDDETILLQMRNKNMFLLKLRTRCIGLSFDESFYYQASPTRQLCARFDTITARSGSRCLIDQIIPFAQQEAGDIKEIKK